jgi:hypothetical protein
MPVKMNGYVAYIWEFAKSIDAFMINRVEFWAWKVSVEPFHCICWMQVLNIVQSVKDTGNSITSYLRNLFHMYRFAPPSQICSM